MGQAKIKSDDTLKPSVQRGQARSALLHAAREALIKGEGKAEMANIAERAGLSVGLAYHHFGSKEGLITAVIETFYQNYSTVANAKYEGGDWANREINRTRAVIAFMVGDPFTRTVLGPMGRHSETLQADANALAELVDNGARNIASGQKSGEISSEINPTLAAAFVLGGLRQCVGLTLAQNTTPDIDALSQHVWAFIAASLNIKSLN